MILQIDFHYKNEIQDQILSSTIEREYYDTKYFLFFSVPKEFRPLPELSCPVALEMQVSHAENDDLIDNKLYSTSGAGIPFTLGQNGKYPTAFLLFVRDRYVFSLEIYNLDGSPIEPELMCIGKRQYGLVKELRKAQDIS